MDQLTCIYCGFAGQPRSFHRDHKVPKFSGGTDDPANIVTACSRCNIAKGVKSYEEFTEALAKFGTVWRDREYRRIALVYRKGDPRNPEAIPKRKGVSNQLIGWSYQERAVRRRAAARRA